MKKFFGLKMTLAALAVVSFASCYDSEGSDVIIPNATTVTWPAPVYVVNGTVTDLANGQVLSDVLVGGVIPGAQKTDANGSYTFTFTSPVSGNVEFTKDGYFKSIRSLNIVGLNPGQGNAIYTVNATMVDLNNAWGIREVLREKDVEVELLEDEAKVATAAQLAAIEAIYGSVLTNNSDVAKTYDMPASLFDDQPYGLIVAASKTQEEAEGAFFRWVNNQYGNDPYEGYGVNWNSYPVTIPAQFQVNKITITPIRVTKTVVIPMADGDYEFPVEEITSYNVAVDGISLAHDHGHGDDNNAGGGGNDAE